ncbi:hypothetical protein BGZ90_012359 [Linnemannia elongata]|nr:hypothetical protein BGZ90_012359 [Linnemannia elongata]
MAGHNMRNIVKTQQLTQTKPLYLLPIEEKGHYLPSQDPKDKVETFGPAQRVSRSKSANDKMPGDSPVRQGKKRKVVMDSNPRVSRSQVREDTIMDEGR